MTGSCPLCAEKDSKASWIGSVRHNGREFVYVACVSCCSLYCDPMPAVEVLSDLYGPNYGENVLHDACEYETVEGSKWVSTWLANVGTGLFVDYGCGEGRLLTLAASTGWRAIGIEYLEEVAREVRARTGHEVLSVDAAHSGGLVGADVLHIGDVIEHLTSLETQLPAILSLLKPTGILLAQGPLEANASLFTAAIRTARRIRPRIREMAPYHVILATAQGQRELFRRMGLRQLEFRLAEVSWPAPACWEAHLLRSPRVLALFCLRRASQIASRFNPSGWGNRYLYAGQLGEAPR